MSLDDKRLRSVPHWQDTVTMPVYHSLDDWQRRKAEIRTQVLFSAGLLPTPNKSALNPLTTGETEYDGYSIRNVAFESFLGFFCTGNLYVPHKPVDPARIPVILSPHGHGQHGRLSQGEHIHAPARFINFALQGYYVLAPDMVGYNDSRQTGPHRALDGDELQRWGISTLGLQLWNNIRALDYLLTLPHVDPTRVAVTGESGGATQTYLLAAVDERVAIASPVNMLSAHYAGGCVCENAPGLRLDLTNMEIVASFAPKPLMLVAATGDWTVNTPRVEYPAVRSIYSLYGAEDSLECVQYDAPHNYNLASRQAVYGFLAKHLGGRGEPVAEHPSIVFSALRSTPLAEAPDIVVHDTEALRVFPTDFPASALPDAASVAAAVKARMHAAFDAAEPSERDDAQRLALRATMPEPADLTFTHREPSILETPQGSLSIERLRIGTKRRGEQIPAILVDPSNSTGTPTLLLSDTGTTHWLNGTTLAPEAATLVEAGHPVLLVDLFLTGSYSSPAGATGRPTTDSHFTTYNRTDAQWRLQDILTSLAALLHLTNSPTANIHSSGTTTHLTTLAHTLAAPKITTIKSTNPSPDLPFIPHLLRLSRGPGGEPPVAP